jgi:protein ImuA
MKPVNLSLDFNLSGSVSQPQHETLATGFAALDAMLPHGGWPVGAVTEIFCPAENHFALPLIWPALAHLSQAQRWLALVAPPNAPTAAQLQAEGIDLSHVLLIHPHGTSNGLWAVEQALRAGTCAAVLSWVNQADHHDLQDLRGAALAGNTCGLIFRPEWAIDQPSPAALRLRLTPCADNSIFLELLEQRKNRPHSAIFIETTPLVQTA